MTAVEIPVADAVLLGDLIVPASARGLILFAHGSGSSRHSPRNRKVARALNAGGFATLLIDLLTPAEDSERAARFDIALLASRMLQVIDAAAALPGYADCSIGLFGASTGAAAALLAAAESTPGSVRAIVSRGGRPDLAGTAVLRRLRLPTLLIVGAADHEVLELNRQALAALAGIKALRIVPGATHLFEEPGALEEVAELARDWFHEHMVEVQATDDAG